MFFIEVTWMRNLRSPRTLALRVKKAAMSQKLPGYTWLIFKWFGNQAD